MVNNIPPQRPSLQDRTSNEPNYRHPSEQNGSAYSHDIRQLVLSIRDHQNELQPEVQEFIQILRENKLYPNIMTENRWAALRNNLGHFRPCRRSGNAFATALRGQDLIYLAIYRVAYPKATAAEVQAFLYRMNYGNINFRFYTASQISAAEALIGMTRKKGGSSVAWQAFLPANIRKRWIYWNLPYPMGIADIRREQMIDLDECGIYFATAERTMGKAYIGVRVREPGPYSRTEKWNLLMAISGAAVENGGLAARRWRNLWLEGGTTIERMVSFLQEILDDIGHANDGNFFVFTMDNLNSHKNAAVVTLIHSYGHGVAYRAPYYAMDGAIELFFNTLQTMLRARLHQITDGNSLVAAVNHSIQSVNSFEGYFIHVGFINN
jgi:hypothetical protein